MTFQMECTTTFLNPTFEKIEKEYMELKDTLAGLENHQMILLLLTFLYWLWMI